MEHVWGNFLEDVGIKKDFRRSGKIDVTLPLDCIV